MFKYIYNLLFPSESEKIRKQIANKYEEAISCQRNGNIRGYSVLMNEISNLEDRLVEIEK
jgi:hypothetical protein|tara:strand:- start:160 stop:339 length:180 start_codon:yes stop_codon:yes gene_type:complete